MIQLELLFEDICEKCGGEGWLWSHELDDPDEDTLNDSMTKYLCDGKICNKEII